MVQHFYKSHKSVIDINGPRNKTQSRRGMQQSSPLLLVLYALFIQEKTLYAYEKVCTLSVMKEKTVKINFKKNHCVRLTDDTAILANLDWELNKILGDFTKTLQSLSLKSDHRTHKSWLPKTGRGI